MKSQGSAGQRFIIDIKLQTRPTTGNDPTYDVIWNSWSNRFSINMREEIEAPSTGIFHRQGNFPALVRKPSDLVIESI